uniref:Cytochrome P450 314A1 n=1 Tax=Maconellicoccus hirsutus TaxID=177089 RepID=A0AAT9UTK6_MACHI
MIRNFLNTVLFSNDSRSDKIHKIYKESRYFDATSDIGYSIWLTFIILTGCSIIKRYWKCTNVREKKFPQDVPGPKAIPIFGTRWIYSLFGFYNLNKVHEAYKDLFHRYGSIVKEEALWNVPVISIMDRDSIEKVLKQSGKYPFRPPNEVTAYYRKSRPDRYTNLGLVNEQGEKWHELRLTLTPELTSNKTMKHFLPELITVTEDFIRLINSSRNDDDIVIDFEQLCNRLGLESTCTLVLGKRFGFLQENNADPMGQILADAIRGQFCASRDTFYGLPLWKVFTTPAYKQFIHCEDTIYDVISVLVENAIEEEAELCATDDFHRVFKSILLAPTLDIRDKKAAIIDFIAAGIKTLGNTLVFLLYLIAKHPDVQEKLYKEIEHITPTNEQITMESLRGAVYLRACIMEAFRLLPTAPCVARILEQKTDINGFTLPPGSVVLCHTWLACLEELNFQRATEFLPERWLEDVNHKLSFLVIPFGYGRRMCPGKRFVELELQVVLTQVIKNYEIHFDGELELEFEFLLGPAPSTKFNFRNRK